MIDCRTCKNYSERSGGCLSVVVCVSGSSYRDTAAVRLFEGPAPTVEAVAWRYTVYGDMVITRSKVQAQHAVEDGFDVEPLYLHPPRSDEVERLRDALKRIADATDEGLASIIAQHALRGAVL